MYYLEVFFDNNESIAIKSLMEQPSLYQLNEFLKKDLPKFGEVKGIRTMSYHEMSLSFDVERIKSWPILTPNETVEIRGAKIKQNYFTSGLPVQYGMEIRMLKDDRFYGRAYYQNSVNEFSIEQNWHYESFSDAYDKLSMAIIKHMINHPILLDLN